MKCIYYAPNCGGRTYCKAGFKHPKCECGDIPLKEGKTVYVILSTIYPVYSGSQIVTVKGVVIGKKAAEGLTQQLNTHAVQSHYSCVKTIIVAE